MLTFLKKFFGTKSEKDIKNIQPLVNEINEIYPTLKNLTHDQLRDKVTALKNKIQDAIKEEQSKITEIKSRIEKEYDMDIELKENLYKEIDDLEKEVTDKIEDILKEILKTDPYIPRLKPVTEDESVDGLKYAWTVKLCGP